MNVLEIEQSPAERGAAGKAARERAPRSSHGDWAPATDRPDPVDVLQAPGRRPSLRSRPPALRPDARLRLHLLSRRRRDHGRRPRGDAGLRALGTGLRGRPPLELRRLRGAGPQPGRRHQRLRRDPPRTVGVGRQTAGREFRDRGPGPRVHGQATTRGSARRDAGLSREHAQPRRTQQSRRLVPAGQRRSDPRSVRTSGQQGGAAQVRAQRRQDPAQGPDAGDVEADRTGRRGAADQNRSAGARAVRADLLGQAAREGRGGPRHGAGGVSRDPPPRPSPPPRRLSTRAHGSQGGRRRQRRNSGLGRSVRRSRRGGPALPPGQGGPAVRARALHRSRPSTRSRASAWWRASG